MVTPKKIIAFVGTVLLILFFISLGFPNSEIYLSEKTSLKFPSIKDIFNPDKIKYADISDLIEESENLEHREDSLSDISGNIIAENIAPTIKAIDTIRASRKDLLKNLRKIEFPKKDSTILFSFFRELSRINKLNTPIRIMHYGDSQIEGDRITSYIRHRLQRQFGGNGAGLLPIVQPYGQFSVKQEVSPNWKRYTVFGKPDTTLYHKRYGAMASFCRFSPHIDKKEQNSYEAWVKLEKGVMGYSTVQHFDYFKIFYGYNKKPFTAEIFADEQMVDADFIPVTNDIKILKWDFDSVPESITIKLKGEDSPDIYALSFESKRGIIMDNIAMRGSSGLIFTKMDKQLLKKMFEHLHVNLIILQYGGNVVPYIKGKSKFYGKSFYNQLLRLKSIVPEVPILVIGPADMSIKEKDYYVTNPVLPKVRDVLKEASFKAGCAYWDMYEAMGGNNSMPSWVFANPPLASSDFIHFNHRGARLIAEMFYNALLYEYNQYYINTTTKNLALVK